MLPQCGVRGFKSCTEYILLTTHTVCVCFLEESVLTLSANGAACPPYATGRRSSVAGADRADLGDGRWSRRRHRRILPAAPRWVAACDKRGGDRCHERDSRGKHVSRARDGVLASSPRRGKVVLTCGASRPGKILMRERGCMKRSRVLSALDGAVARNARVALFRCGIDQALSVDIAHAFVVLCVALVAYTLTV